MAAVVETTQVPVSAAVEQAAQGGGLGELRQAFLLLTKVRVFGRARDEETLRVYEYDEGLVRDGGGRELEVFRWDEIDAVLQSFTPQFQGGRYSGTTFAYRFKRADGATFMIDGIVEPGISSGDSVSDWIARLKG